LQRTRVLNPPYLFYKPQTLKQFRELWDMLGDPGFGIEVPAMVDTNGYLRCDHSVRPVRFKLVRTGKQQTVEYLEHRSNNHYLQSGTDTTLRIYSSVQVGDLGSSTPHPFGYYLSINWVQPVTHSCRAEIFIPITSDRRLSVEGQSALISHATDKKKWKHGKFEYSFSRLNRSQRNTKR
jgi:hypothetical protein